MTSGLSLSPKSSDEVDRGGLGLLVGLGQLRQAGSGEEVGESRPGRVPPVGFKVRGDVGVSG